MNDHQYIVYMSIKDDKGMLQDVPLRPFTYEHEAQTYLTGYVDAIENHTGGNDSRSEIEGQFSIRTVAGDVNVNKEEKSSTIKESS